MTKKILLLGSLALTTFFSSKLYAAEFPVQARLFVGVTSVDPKNVNEVTEAQGLQKIDKSTQLGLEITYPVLSHLNVGVRYSKRIVSLDENPSNEATDYIQQVNQDALLLVARAPFVKSDTFLADAFVGVGGTNTTFKVKTASQDGELTASAGDGWAASPYAAAGLSAAVGYKQFFFVVEAGYEYNKASSFKRSGNVDSRIDTLDMSGGYVTIGLLFDGVKGFTK